MKSGIASNIPAMERMKKQTITRRKTNISFAGGDKCPSKGSIITFVIQCNVSPSLEVALKALYVPL